MATYAIGEFSLIPADYHNLLFYRPLALYYASIEDVGNSERYWKMYDGGKEAGLSNEYGGMLKQMIENELDNFEGVYLEPLEEDVATIQDLAITNNIIGESW